MLATRVGLALAVVIVLAGCLGSTGPGGNGAAPGAETGSVTPTVSPTEPAVTTDPTSEVVDARELPPATRRVVGAAVEDGSATTDRSRLDGLDGLEPGDATLLRYAGSRYRLSVEHASYRAEYALGRVERVNASSVDPADDVVAGEALSPAGRRLVEDALAGASSDLHDPAAFPSELRRADLVEYRGTYYRPVVVVADVPRVRLEAEPVEPDAGTPTPTD